MSKGFLIAYYVSLLTGTVMVEGAAIYRLAGGPVSDGLRVIMFVGGVLALVPIWTRIAHDWMNRGNNGQPH